MKSTETKKREKQESLPVLLPGGGYYRKYDLHVNQPHSFVRLVDMLVGMTKKLKMDDLVNLQPDKPSSREFRGARGF